MVNLKVTVLHNKMWIIWDTEEPSGTMHCSCNKAWLGYTVFCVCLEALPARMNRQKQEMTKVYPIGWKCLGIACIPNYNQYIC